MSYKTLSFIRIVTLIQIAKWNKVKILIYSSKDLQRKRDSTQKLQKELGTYRIAYYLLLKEITLELYLIIKWPKM